MMRDGLAWLSDTLLQSEVAGQTITYTRGATTVSLQATYGHKLLKLSEKFDSRLAYSDGDFEVSVSEIAEAFAAKSVTFTAPQRGDEIAAAFEDGTFRHEVKAPGNEPHFQRDTYHLLYLIHTQRIS